MHALIEVDLDPGSEGRIEFAIDELTESASSPEVAGHEHHGPPNTPPQLRYSGRMADPQIFLTSGLRQTVQPN